MRRIVHFTILLPVAAMLLAAPTRAAEEQKTLQFGVAGGLNVPVGTTSDSVKTGFHVKGLIKFTPPSSPVAFRGDLSYTQFQSKNTGFDPGKILAGVANISISPFKIAGLRPYVSAGVGAFNLKAPVATGAASDTSETKFGIDAGVGVTFKLGGGNGFVETRFNNIYTNRGLANLGDVRYLPVTFGILF